MFTTRTTPRTPHARVALRTPFFHHVLLVGFAVVASVGSAAAATVESSNFRVTASSPEIAEQLALTAEELRDQIAREWLGEELPPWTSPCVVFVDTSAERMTGDTTYQFGGGRVRRWRMTLRGPLERIVESLLPHEIAHTVLASYFRRAIPRWADEGVALMAEDEVDRRRVRAIADSCLDSELRLAVETFLDTDEYPADKQRMRALYAQAASFTEFLVLAGRQRFLAFVTTGLDEGWVIAAKSLYGFESLADAERCWREWEAEDRPHLEIAGSVLLAGAARRYARASGPDAQSPADRTDTATTTAAVSVRRAASMPEPSDAQ